MPDTPRAPHRRAASWWVALRPPAVALACLVLVASGWGIVRGYRTLAGETAARRYMQDFGIFHQSVQQYHRGGSLYTLPAGRTTGRVSGFRNLNLPHLHLALIPLGWLPGWLALAVWMAASAVALADAVRRTHVAAGIRLPWLAALALLVYLIAWAPTAAMVLTFQVSLLVMWPVVLGWLAARHGCWVQAGAWIGLAAALKPFLLILLPYMWLRRQYAAVGWALAVIAVLVAAGALVFGTVAYAEWLDQVLHITWGGHYMNASFAGVLGRSLGRVPFYATFEPRPWLVAPLAAAASLAAGIATLAAARAAGERPALDAAWSALLLVSLLMSPVGWVYYFWIPLLPLAATLHHVRPWRRRRAGDLLLVAAAIALLASGQTTVWGQPSPWATATIASAYFWGLLALWSWALRETVEAARRRPPAGLPG